MHCMWRECRRTEQGDRQLAGDRLTFRLTPKGGAPVGMPPFGMLASGPFPSSETRETAFTVRVVEVQILN